MASGAPPIQEIKQMMKAMWMSGDFGKIAERMGDAPQAFVSRLGIKLGMRVLDVGCGTGNQSIPAAKLGAKVTGADIAPNLLAQAVKRAGAEELEIDFREGDAEALPFADGEFDVVLSMFGAIFAPRPEKVVSEFLRVCRSGGLIAMANWTPASFVGQQNKMFARYTPPPPPNLAPPMLWGDEAKVRERFGDAVELSMSKQPFVFDLPFGPAEAEAYFRQHLGPMQMIMSRLDAERQKEFVAEMVEHWTRSSEGDANHTLIKTEYLEVHARKK